MPMAAKFRLSRKISEMGKFIIPKSKWVVIADDKRVGWEDNEN